MTEHHNADSIRTLANAFTAGDLDTVIDSYAGDGIYRVGGNNQVSGVYRGKQAIRDMFADLVAVTEGKMSLTTDDVIGADKYAVLFWAGTIERPGKSLAPKGTMAFKIGDDGKITESWFLYEDQRAFDEFFS